MEQIKVFHKMSKVGKDDKLCRIIHWKMKMVVHIVSNEIISKQPSQNNVG